MKELQAEIKENSRRLELMQSGIDPDRKSAVRKRYVSPGLKSNNSRRSGGSKNFISNNRRVASLSTKRKVPAYSRPTGQFRHRNQTTSRSPANRFSSGSRGAFSYGRRPGQITRSKGINSNSRSKKRANTKPQVSGVFGRLYQSKQRDSSIRSNKRVSPGYRVGSYKRSPVNRHQRPSPGAQGINKRSPSGRSGPYFQVSSRLYPGPSSKSRERSKDKSNNSQEGRKFSRNRVNNNYGRANRNNSGKRSNSYGRVPRPFHRPSSGGRSNSKDRVAKPSSSTNSAVFDRLYNSGSRKNSKKRAYQKPPTKPAVNNYMDRSKNSDLEEVKENSWERTARYSQRRRNK